MYRNLHSNKRFEPFYKIRFLATQVLLHAKVQIVVHQLPCLDIFWVKLLIRILK